MAGTLQSSSFKTIVAKSGSRSAEDVNCVPRVASTNRLADAMTLSGLNA